MDRSRAYRMERPPPAGHRAVGGEHEAGLTGSFQFPRQMTDGSNNSGSSNNQQSDPRRPTERQCYVWTKIPTLNGVVPPPRSGAASVVTKHPVTGAARLWILAGYGGEISRLSDFYYYDFTTGLWEIVNVLSQERPGPRENNGVVLSDSTSQCIYLFGGVSLLYSCRLMEWEIPRTFQRLTRVPMT